MSEAQRGYGLWVPQEMLVAVDGNVDRVPDFDPRTGEHLWTWGVLFRATPGVEEPMLDAENLLRIAGIGCYYCERVYGERLAQRRCPGRPSGESWR